MAKETNKGYLRTYGFTRVNLIILLISIVVIVIGYLLMHGGKSADGVSFDEEVFNTMRTRIAPVVLTLGYLGILVAVLWRGKKEHSEHGETSEEAKEK